MPVTVTIEDERSERDPAVFAIPDGCRIVVRRCADGADVLVLPGSDASLPSKTIVSAGEAHRIATWCILDREHEQSFLLRLQDSHGRDHDFTVIPRDLVGIGTAALSMTGHEVSYEAARTRKMVAEAELVEAEIAASRRPAPNVDGKPLVAQSWSVERIKAADSSPAFVVRMVGEGRTAEAQLSGYLAATMCGRLGLIVSICCPNQSGSADMALRSPIRPSSAAPTPAGGLASVGRGMPMAGVSSLDLAGASWLRPLLGGA